MGATITREDLQTKLDRGERFLLVETLPTHAYHHVHLPGTINLQPERVRELAPALLPEKSAVIVGYCSTLT